MNRWRPDEPINRHIGKRIKQRREDLGINQTDLGAALNISFQQIQKYEKGKSILSAAKLHVLAHQLGVPITWFFE